MPMSWRACPCFQYVWCLQLYTESTKSLWVQAATLCLGLCRESRVISVWGLLPRSWSTYMNMMQTGCLTWWRPVVVLPFHDEGYWGLTQTWDVHALLNAQAATSEQRVWCLCPKRNQMHACHKAHNRGGIFSKHGCKNLRMVWETIMKGNEIQWRLGLFIPKDETSWPAIPAQNLWCNICCHF